MKKIFVASSVYLVLGLAAGVFYREFTKLSGFVEGEKTQLSILHTHLLTLGFLVMLVVLILEKLFDLAADWRFNGFFWLYNSGLVVTTAMMTLRGMNTVKSVEVTEGLSAAIAGIAGLGHIAGLGLLMIVLGTKIFKPQH